MAFTVGMGMLGAVVSAKVLGGVLPLVLSRLGWDPALMSAPLITTIVDCVALSIYLGLATVLLL